MISTHMFSGLLLQFYIWYHDVRAACISTYTEAFTVDVAKLTVLTKYQPIPDLKSDLQNPLFLPFFY